jgi:hypothetical protein
MHYHQSISPRRKYVHAHRPLVKLYARVALREQHRTAEVGPRIQGFIDALHQPSAKPIRLMLGNDEDVREVGKAGLICDKAAEADLGWRATA